MRLADFLRDQALEFEDIYRASTARPQRLDSAGLCRRADPIYPLNRVERVMQPYLKLWWHEAEAQFCFTSRSPAEFRQALGFGPQDSTISSPRFGAPDIDLDDGIVSILGAFVLNLSRGQRYGGVRVPSSADRVFPLLASGGCGLGDRSRPSPTRRLPPLLHDFERSAEGLPGLHRHRREVPSHGPLGTANTRLKDFYDVAVIARRTKLDGTISREQSQHLRSAANGTTVRPTPGML